AANQCTNLLRNDAPQLGFRLGQVEAGSNHALCATYSDKTGIPRMHCQLFSVLDPFFPAPRPYFVPSDPNGPVIFGVLDPSLVGYIGQLSDVWMNTDRRFETTGEIIDPIEALRQALSFCDADSTCRGRRKVLLAQMPFYKASQLAAKLKMFDMVVAQPDEEHASGNEFTSRSGAHDSPYVLTPGITFDSHNGNPLGTNLRRADYYVEGVEQHFIANQVYNSIFPSPHPEPCRTCSLNEEVAKITAQPSAKKHINTSYEDLALEAMQGFCGSDVAMLQHRDAFSAFGKAVALWPTDFHPTPQQLLDEMLWKGDFAFCLPVKGSTLKKVLDESAVFDKQDRDNLSVEVEKGRGLSTLGIETDPGSGASVIRGQPVEDNKLYGVAMTDYLAFGNTGYPELSSEAVEPVVRVTDLKSLNRLTGLACQRLSASFTQNSCQSDAIAAADYFEAIRQRPFDTSRGLTALLEFRNWISHPLQAQPTATTFLEKKSRTPENVVEKRGLWWFTLQNVTLGYNLNFIKGSDKTVPGNFTGNNSFSQLSTPESSQFSLWARARGGYSFPRFIDFFMSTEVRYSRLAVRTFISNGNFGEYQLTLASNLLRAESGITTKPLTQRVPVRLLLSEDLLTQPTTPFQQFSVPLPCGVLPCKTGTALTTFDLSKNYLVLTRFGARIQNDQSWFEAGREYGQNVDIPYSYSLQDLATPVNFECPLSTGLSLSNCVSTDALFSSQSKVLSHLRTQHVAGWFANFHSAVPIWRSKLQLVADSYGEVFDRLSSDTTYNTRFYEDLTFALKVPIWGNLSFAPQVETFYFQNKILPGQIAVINHYVFVTTSVALQYGFDWHRGVGIVRALQFPNGVSTATSGTVPRP
ncbi:MAG: 5'-nucleotidase C-terminal domain-containing protein, partial [Acidobacteriota bacterium]|nr:5'-nucleotidase C-terminal domain-containing protein [Acidobacteriota bacterium]